MEGNLAAFLREVADADGVDAPEEREALALIERTLTGARALSLKQAASDLADWGATLGTAASELSTEAQTRARDTLTAASTVATKGAAAVAERIARLRGRDGAV